MNDSNTLTFSRSVVDWALSKEYIYPLLWKGEDVDMPITYNPAWLTMYNRIKSKYGIDYAARNVLKAKILWYENKKDWSNLITSEIKKIDSYGLDTSGTLAKVQINNLVWYHIFLHCSDHKILAKAAKWMELVLRSSYLRNDPLYSGWIDTYANVLYKSGKIGEALHMEMQAINLDPGNLDLVETYKKMKEGVSTWQMI